MFVSYLFTTPLDKGVTLHWVYGLDLGPPRESLKNHQISSLLPRPSKITKSAHKVTKRHQKVTQIPPSGHQFKE